MPDQNEILRHLAAQAGAPDAAEQLREVLRTPDGKKAAQVISSQHAAALERAAQAAQRGDMGEAARLAQQLMQTPEGANLAQKLRQIFRK
nr:hypothetical protein [uncultured Agathobaculum sp.]